MSVVESNDPSRRTRVIMVSILLGICFIFIGLILFDGNPENSLHQSALGWFFSIIIVLVIGYLLGESNTVHNVLVYFGKR